MGELNASPSKPPSEREVDAEGRRKELTVNLSLSFRKTKTAPSSEGAEISCPFYGMQCV